MTSMWNTTDPRMNGEVVVIVGGGRGAGLEAAAALGRANAFPILVEADAVTARKGVAALAARGVTAHAYGADPTDATDLSEVLAAIEDDFGPSAILVNAVRPLLRLDGRASGSPGGEAVPLALAGPIGAAEAHWRKPGRQGRLINLGDFADGGGPMLASEAETETAIIRTILATAALWRGSGLAVGGVCGASRATPRSAEAGRGRGGLALVSRLSEAVLRLASADIAEVNGRLVRVQADER